MRNSIGHAGRRNKNTTGRLDVIKTLLGSQVLVSNMYSITDRVKIVVTGSSGVGKTNTVRRLRNEAFSDFYEETSGKT